MCSHSRRGGSYFVSLCFCLVFPHHGLFFSNPTSTPVSNAMLRSLALLSCSRFRNASESGATDQYVWGSNLAARQLLAYWLPLKHGGGPRSPGGHPQPPGQSRRCYSTWRLVSACETPDPLESRRGRASVKGCFVRPLTSQ